MVVVLLTLAGSPGIVGEQNIAGDARDTNPTTFKFDGFNRDRTLTKSNGTPILPEEVPTLYGTQDGFTIFGDELDVTGEEYREGSHLHRPLEPVFQDLSIYRGWPSTHVTPGTVAIDPVLGRFKFSEGDNIPLREVATLNLPNGRAMDMEIIGNFAYIANDEMYMGLTVVNISDPQDPIITGYCKAGRNPSSIDVILPYAYVMDGYCLFIFDVTDPGHPLQVAVSNSLGTGAYGIDVVQVGQKTIAFCGSQGSSGKTTLYILDVTVPSQINILSKFEFDWADSVYDVAVNMPYAYLLVRSTGVLIVDVSNLNIPRYLVIFNANIERGCQLVPHGKYLYLSDFGKGLRILDVSNIYMPKEIYFDWLLDDLDDVHIDTDIKYAGIQSACLEDSRRTLTSKPVPVTPGQAVELVLWAKGFQTHDEVDPPRHFAGGYQILWDGEYKSPQIGGLISDSDQFKRVSRNLTVPQGVSTMQLRLSSGIWDSAQTRGTIWFDDVQLRKEGRNTLGNPGFEDEVGRFQMGYIYTRGIAFSDYKMLVSDYTEGVRLIDASTPTYFRVICRYVDETQEYSTFIRSHLNRDFAFLVEENWGLKTLSVKAPTMPRIVGSVCTAGFVQDLVAIGNYSYVANTFSGIWTIDVGDPINPKIVGGYHTGDSITQLAMDNKGYLYCANSVLERIDVLDTKSDPKSPIQVASVKARAVMKMVVGQNLLFVASNEDPDLYVFNITNPREICLEGTLEFESEAGYRGLAVSQGLLGMACFEGGFHLVDVKNPKQPVHLGSFDDQGEYAWGVAIRDGTAYVSYRNRFIRIFDIANPTEPKELDRVYDDLSWPWNMLISGDLMHVTDYKGGIMTYDISDPISPVQLDRLNHSYAVDLDLTGEFLYEGQYGSLKIHDCRHSSQAPEGVVSVIYNGARMFMRGIQVIGRRTDQSSSIISRVR